MTAVARVAAGLLALGVAAACVRDSGPRHVATAVYEYTYEYPTPALDEDHTIVLEWTDGPVRGWYYGTSDEFDGAREGYLPGFFVAEMTALELSADSIAFTLARPDTLFAAPVPLAWRSAGDVPPGTLEPWTAVALPAGSKTYRGALAGDSIVLGDPARVFRRVATDGAAPRP